MANSYMIMFLKYGKINSNLKIGGFTMIFCEECGTKLSEGTTKCPNCGAIINAVTNTEENSIEVSKDDSAVISDTVQKGSITPNETKQTVNEQQTYQYQQPNYVQQPIYQKYQQSYNMAQMHGLILAEGEKFIRQYQCSYIQSFFHWISILNCKGYLTITNQRVIFQGKGPVSRINTEISLNSVCGFDSYCGKNISIIGILFGIVVIFMGLSMLTSYFNKEVFMGLFFILIGIFIIYCSIQKSFLFKIFSSRGTSPTITLGVGPLTSFGNSALKTLKSAPTQDTDRMINELGAVIHDLQTMGDKAIEKWSK